MHKPPSEHDEWLEENQEPKKRELPKKTPAPRPRRAQGLTGPERTWQNLKDDIQEYG